MVDKLPALRSRQAVFISLVILFAAVFFLPYLFPVTPAVALSFLVGYNNRVAYLLFAFGSILVAILVRKSFPDSEAVDQPLGLFSLVLASLITLLYCAGHVLPVAQHGVPSEGAYTLNRVQMLASGLRPYIDFEYAYGPAHLYLPVFFAHMAHSSVVRGYYLWWIVQWLTGTVMLWTAIRLLDLPVPRRRLVFWFLFILQLPAVQNDGAAYTPTRTIGAAFFIVIVAYLWNRVQRPIMTALAALLCIFLAFAISPEQGIAVFVGLLGWFLLLASQKPNDFTTNAATFFACGGAIIVIACWRLGEFKTLFEFSVGAFSLPLLPSPANIIVLSSYVVTACIAVQYLLTRRVNSVVIPLFVSGYALLPAAFGRCDLYHLMIASPILFLGIAAIESRATLRTLWSPLAICLVFIPLIAMTLLLMMAGHQHQLTSLEQTASLNHDPAIFSTAPAPCPVIYRALNVAPKPNETDKQDCLDTGYFFLTTNAFTAQSVELMLTELNRPPLHPLVLLDKPLAEQFPPREANVKGLYDLELSLWVPQPRNPPFTLDKLVKSIEFNYTPDPTPTGAFRIWHPNATSPPGQ